MGREWYWSRSIGRGEERESPGCMSGMLQFFDFNQFLFTTHPPPTTSSTNRAVTHSFPQGHHPPAQLKGVEAPRNSLELDEGRASSTSAIREEYYDIPVGIQLAPASVAIQKANKKAALLLEEERRSSQVGTPRTPSVVARLMGLEVLPDQETSPPINYHRPPSASPSPPPPPLVRSHEQTLNKKKKQHGDASKRESPPRRQPLQIRNCNISTSPMGSRSLPDTPRVSSARRSWDSDPRLSFNKENTNREEFNYLCEVSGESYYSLSPSPLPSLTTKLKKKKDNLREQDENKSPRSHYFAREIVKQVKESITNRRGVNGSSCSGDDHHGRRRASEKKTLRQDEPWMKSPALKQSPPSCSPPPIRFLDPPKSPLPPKPPRPMSSPSLPTKTGPGVCKKASCERFTERIKKQPPPPLVRQDALYAHTSSSSSPSPKIATVAPLEKPSWSEKTKHNSISSSFVAIKRKEPSPPPLPPPPKIHPTSPMKKVNGAGGISTEKSRRCPEPNEEDPEFRYVMSILKQTGISGTVDPIVFHKLELELELPGEGEESQTNLLLGPLRHRWNRKLLFHLVDEILGDLLGWAHLNPTNHPSKWDRCRGSNTGEESLLRRLWSEIRSFPSAECHVIADIDALVEGDLPESNVRRLLIHPAVWAEAEAVSAEIEGDILDALVGEAAAYLALFQHRVVTVPDLTSL